MTLALHVKHFHAVKNNICRSSRISSWNIHEGQIPAN